MLESDQGNPNFLLVPMCSPNRCSHSIWDNIRPKRNGNETRKKNINESTRMFCFRWKQKIVSGKINNSSITRPSIVSIDAQLCWNKWVEIAIWRETNARLHQHSRRKQNNWKPKNYNLLFHFEYVCQELFPRNIPPRLRQLLFRTLCVFLRFFFGWFVCLCLFFTSAHDDRVSGTEMKKRRRKNSEYHHRMPNANRIN